MIVLQLMLFCALFTLMVKIGVGNNALNGLYFYPKPVQERVYELVRRDRDRQALGRTQQVLGDPRNRGNPLCSDLTAGFEETGDPDADLDCRGSSHCRNRCAPLT